MLWLEERVVLLSKRAKNIGLVLVVLCWIGLQYGAADLEFDRQRILSGQLWRLWTGHFVHSHWLHFSLNGAAVLALYVIFIERFRVSDVLLSMLLFPLVISCTLLIFYPYLAWYNGLSGVLHAVVGYACIRFAFTRSGWYGLGFFILWGKVLLELLQHYQGYSYELAGMMVITQAHFIGAVVGTLIGLVVLLKPCLEKQYTAMTGLR